MSSCENPIPGKFPAILDRILAILPPDQVIYLVGGAVRDLLLGRKIHDFDFVLPGGGIHAARKIANVLKAGFYLLDPERDTGRIIYKEVDGTNIILDFTGFRGSDLHADLLGRDFCLNAIALDIRNNKCLDPLGGVKDLKEKHIRACSPTTFTDDPVRILRAIRIASDFDFLILPRTKRLLVSALPKLAGVSAERIRDEVFRIFQGPAPSRCLRVLDKVGALQIIFPELVEMQAVQQPSPHVYPVWEHTLVVIQWLEKILGSLTPDYSPEEDANIFNALLNQYIGRYRSYIANHLFSPRINDRTPRGCLMLAALYHDIAKPQKRLVDAMGRIHFWEHDIAGEKIILQRAHRLALSNNEVDRLGRIVRNHMRLPLLASRLLKEGKMPTRRAIYRFFRDTDFAGVDLCLLALADCRATYGQELTTINWTVILKIVRLLLENWYEKPEESIAPPSLLDGDQLMQELNLPSGPKIGELLGLIREAQAVGEVSTKEEALALALSRL